MEKYYTKHYNQDIEDNKKQGLIVVLVLVTVLFLTVLYTLAIAFDFFEPLKMNFNTENKHKKWTAKNSPRWKTLDLETPP